MAKGVAAIERLGSSTAAMDHRDRAHGASVGVSQTTSPAEKRNRSGKEDGPRCNRNVHRRANGANSRAAFETVLNSFESAR